MKRKIIAVSSILVIAIVSLCIFIHTKDETPKIEAVIGLKNISEDEYYSLADFNQYDKKNIKKLEIQIHVTNAGKCKTRDIRIPELNMIDQIDHIRSLSMSSFSENNTNENHAEFSKTAIFDITGLSINTLKEAFAGKNIVVHIITKNNNEISKEFHIDDYLSSLEA